MSLADRLRASRREVLRQVENFDARDFIHRPFPGANHAAWTLAHLVSMDARGAALLGVPADPFDGWHAVSDAGCQDDGLSSIQLLRDIQESHALLLRAVASLTLEDLLRPPPAAMGGVFPDLASVVVGHLWHDGYHAGQLASIRRSLGLPPPG